MDTFVEEVVDPILLTRRFYPRFVPQAVLKRRATAMLSWFDCSTTLARLDFRRRN